MPTSESAIVTNVLRHLKSLPQCHAHKVWGGPYGQAGEPDIDGCLRGRSLKVEVKMPGKKPTALQHKSLRRWQDAGALAGWVTSVDELRELLSHADDPEWRNPQL